MGVDVLVAAPHGIRKENDIGTLDGSTKADQEVRVTSYYWSWIVIGFRNIGSEKLKNR
jgi:hypothetical protein